MRKKMNRSRKVGLVAISILLISALYYLVPSRQVVWLELVTRLYYIPIIMGALWFGVRGGLESSVAVSFVCLPHVFKAFGQDQAFFYDELLEIFLFNLIGPAVGALQDRYQREKALNHKLETLATLGETMASVSHDIKNLLIPIRGFLRRIRESQFLEGKAASYLEIVECESAKLEKMTRNMLSFARFAPLQRKEMEVSSFLEDVRKLLQNEFDESGVQLISQCRCNGERVSLDPDKISNALVNLLQNARHASQRGKTVQLLAQCSEKVLQIVVEDEGGGIAKEDLDRIFMAFFTTKPQGTGLGLAITKRNIKEHGGDIQVHSVRRQGTRVSLTLPISQKKFPLS